MESFRRWLPHLELEKWSRLLYTRSVVGHCRYLVSKWKQKKSRTYLIKSIIWNRCRTLPGLLERMTRHVRYSVVSIFLRKHFINEIGSCSYETKPFVKKWRWVRFLLFLLLLFYTTHEKTSIAKSYSWLNQQVLMGEPPDVPIYDSRLLMHRLPQLLFIFAWA